MPSARIHEVISIIINKDYKYDELLLRIGTVAPDSWRNVESGCGIKDKYLSHFWDFRIKEGQANDYLKFYIKYYDDLSNPFYFGYLIHLIVDQYWKTYIDNNFVLYKNGIKYYKLKDGSLHDDLNYYGYRESLKIQKQLAKKYKLGLFPIYMKDINNFICNIDELNLNGLFGQKGTLNYINTNIFYNEDDIESDVYDISVIDKYINDTVVFVKKELKKLEDIKNSNDKKIKIAVDIDETILNTWELVEKYWKIYVVDHPGLGDLKKYDWDNPKLTSFFDEYRDKISFGSVKDGVEFGINSLIKKGYIVDLLSARPIAKNAFLMKDFVNYLNDNNVNYNFMFFGYSSKASFLKQHKYDIFIDDNINLIKEIDSKLLVPILFNNNDLYDGYKINNWYKIPLLIDEIINNDIN